MSVLGRLLLNMYYGILRLSVPKQVVVSKFTDYFGVVVKSNPPNEVEFYARETG